MSTEQDCRSRSRRRKPLHPLNSMHGLSDQSEDEGTLGSLDSEGRAAKRARRELVSSSESSGSESVTLAPLPIPPTPEEAAAASREQAEEAAEYLNFLSSLPHISKVARRSRGPLLPPPRPGRDGRVRKTLVLDLDHTLIRSTLFNPHKPAKDSREVFVTGDGARTAFERRPHLTHFLESVSTLFEIVVFTAGSQSYAGPLLDILDPERRLFEHRLFRDSCLRVPSHSQPGLAFLMKNMSALGRDLAHTVIVDNTPTVFGYQLDNGIPIASWYEDAADCELLHLLPFLAKLAAAPDVRPLVAQRFPLHRMVHSAMSKFPVAFPCAQPAPGPEAQRPPLPPPAPADTASLGLLADACMGLACDEDLGNSPFEALDDDDDDISAAQPQDQAVELPGIADEDLAPVERMAAEADAALSAMAAGPAAPVTGQPDLVPVGCAAAHLEPESPSASELATEALPAGGDAESMWAAEAIAEADMLSHLECVGSPVEAVAQLSLPMFPEAVTPPETPVRGNPPPAPFMDVQSASGESAGDSAEAASGQQQLAQLASLVRRSSSEGMPGQRQVISGFETDLAGALQQRPCRLGAVNDACGSSRQDSGRLREAASAPPTLDLTDYLLDQGPRLQSNGLNTAGRLPGQLHRLPMGRAGSASASLDLDALEELFAPSSLIGSILSASSADSTEGGGSLCGPKEVQSPQIACA